MTENEDELTNLITQELITETLALSDHYFWCGTTDYASCPLLTEHRDLWNE